MRRSALLCAAAQIEEPADEGCDDDDPEYRPDDPGPRTIVPEGASASALPFVDGAVPSSDGAAAEGALSGSGARTGSVFPSTWFTGTSSSPYRNTTGRNRPSSVRLM